MNLPALALRSTGGIAAVAALPVPSKPLSAAIYAAVNGGLSDNAVTTPL